MDVDNEVQIYKIREGEYHSLNIAASVLDLSLFPSHSYELAKAIELNRDEYTIDPPYG